MSSMSLVILIQGDVYMAFNGECLFILFSEKLPCLSRCIRFHDASRFVNSNHCLFLLVKFQGYSNRFS